MTADRIFRRISNRSIGVIRNDNLVAFAKIKTAQDRIHAACCIVDEDKVAAVYTQKLRYLIRRSAKPWPLRRCFPDARICEFSQKKSRRLLFNFLAKFLLGVQNAPGRSTDGSVVEVSNGRIQT